MTFLIFSSQAFMSRTKVCIDSIKKFHPECEIILKPFEGTHKDGYLEGLAPERLKIALQLLEDGKEVTIMGADCVLYDRLDSFINALGAVILTPHVVNPPPTKSNELYQSGHANADLILFRGEGGKEVLRWLLSQEMKIDVARGYFLEQTLLSSLPFIFENITIHRDETINYAYYNFYERPLSKIDSTYYINEKPLVMVQYSGFEVGRPEKASKHSDIITENEVRKLFIEYNELIS